MTDLAEIVALAIRRTAAFIDHKPGVDHCDAMFYSNELSEAAIAALREAGALVEWKPIESAPMDGSIIDLWAQPIAGGEYGRVAECWWSGSCWRSYLTGLKGSPSHREVHNPIRWSPLPKPPEGV